MVLVPYAFSRYFKALRSWDGLQTCPELTSHWLEPALWRGHDLGQSSRAVPGVCL